MMIIEPASFNASIIRWRRSLAGLRPRRSRGRVACEERLVSTGVLGVDTGRAFPGCELERSLSGIYRAPSPGATRGTS